MNLAPDRWRSLFERDLLLIATVGLSLVNGFDISPLFDSMAFYLYAFTKGYPLIGADALYYLTSLALSALTLLSAGIPAALYERARGLKHSTPVSLGIWLSTALLLSLPTITRLLIEDL